MSRSGWRVAIGAAGMLTLTSACDRDPRVEQRRAPSAGDPPAVVTQIQLEPGQPVSTVAMQNPYEGSVMARQEGARLYQWFNCSGCHFEGGGGIGPPLMDDDWIYGGRPDQIFDSIASGRTNGMPAYGARVPSDEIWKIVTYVQSLATDDERPGRGLRRSQAGEEP